MKKIFKYWEWYEIVFLVASLLIISLCFVFSPIKNYLSFFSSIVGIITVILMAKGFVIAPIISIIYNALYIIISIHQKYYGEAIIYLS